jgi:hypothetical protein
VGLSVFTAVLATTLTTIFVKYFPDPRLLMVTISHSNQVTKFGTTVTESQEAHGPGRCFYCSEDHHVSSCTPKGDGMAGKMGPASETPQAAILWQWLCTTCDACCRQLASLQLDAASSTCRAEPLRKDSFPPGLLPAGLALSAMPSALWVHLLMLFITIEGSALGLAPLVLSHSGPSHSGHKVFACMRLHAHNSAGRSAGLYFCQNKSQGCPAPIYIL